MGLVTVLYVFVKVSLFLPQWVEVRAFSILIVFPALSFEVLICSLNVSLGSKVSPSILGLRIVGSRVLSSCSDSSSLYSAGSGVKSVIIVLLATPPLSPLLSLIQSVSQQYLQFDPIHNIDIYAFQCFAPSISLW